MARMIHGIPVFRRILRLKMGTASTISVSAMAHVPVKTPDRKPKRAAPGTPAGMGN